MGFTLRPKFVQSPPERIEAAAERTGKLSLRDVQRLFAPGADDIGDRFCLNKIHLAIDEGAEGELPRLRHPTAGGEQQPEQGIRSRRSTVTVKLHHIVAGVAGGGFHVDGERAVAACVSEQHRPGICRRERSLAVPHSVADGEGVGAGDAEDGNRSADPGRGCCDVVTGIHHFIQ